MFTRDTQIAWTTPGSPATQCTWKADLGLFEITSGSRMRHHAPGCASMFQSFLPLLASQANKKATIWEVPYLPIDPQDRSARGSGDIRCQKRRVQPASAGAMSR